MNNAVAPHLQALTEGPNIPLDKPIVLIGRHQECDIQIPSRKISRRHCCLALANNHLVVRDLGSTNGIRINGVKMVEGSLQPGDELTLGNVRYQLKWGNEAPAELKNGIVAQKAPQGKRVRTDDSGEMPVALVDVSLSQPVLQGKPLSPPVNHHAENGRAQQNASLQVPDNINLVPLDPP